MKLPYIFALLIIIQWAEAPTPDFLQAACADTAAEEDCTVNGQNTYYCPPDVCADEIDPYPMPFSVTLLATTEESNGDCCYTYSMVATGGPDCQGKSKGLSHLTFGVVCPEDDVTITSESGTTTPYSGFELDGATCMNGVKIDDDDAETYTLCLKYDGADTSGGTCCDAPGWFMAKAGGGLLIGETQVPECTCPTKDPTKSPSESPSKSPSKSPSESPSKSPSESPSKSPSKFPSKSPSKSPSKFPSKSPSNSPSKSPTPYCLPVVQIWVNNGCTELDPYEYWDSDVAFTALKKYGPNHWDSDVLEYGVVSGRRQQVLDDACGEQTTGGSAHAFIAPRSPDINPLKKVETHLEWYQYPNVALGLLVYCVSFTMVACVYIAMGSSKALFHGGKHVDYVGSDDLDEEDAML